MKKIGILSILLALTFTACRKDTEEIIVEENPYVPEILEQWEQPVEPVNGSLTGFVANEFGLPVSGATVKLGNLTTTTDTYGHFFFNDITMNARGAFVLVEQTGYFNGSRRFFPVADQNHRVKIELLTKTFAASFSADAGGTVTMNGGATVDFPPNSIRDAAGNAYSGTVRVAARWLDPSLPSTLDRMPGNLQGVDQLNNEVALSTYGMMAVELESPAGEPLNLLSGSTATLSMPVPDGLLAGAPTEIPLWSFHETHGVWAEESRASLQGGNYVGEVSHFSFWNCDAPIDLVEFSATLVEINGTPLYNYKVGISVIGPGGSAIASGYGYTGANGVVSGLIPAGEPLALTVYDPCGEVIFSMPMGPFSGDTDLGIVPVTINSTTISGELVDCDGNAVQDGLLIIRFSGQTIYEYVNGGSFALTFLTCANTTGIEVFGADPGNLQQSADPVTAGAGGTFDLGVVVVCGAPLQNYIRVTVTTPTDSYTSVYTPAHTGRDSSSAEGLITTFSYGDWQVGQRIYLSITGPMDAPGDYSSQNGIYQFKDPVIGFDKGQEIQSFSTFSISEFGDTGEPIIGTFGGVLDNYDPQLPATVTVTGDFNIVRDF